MSVRLSGVYLVSPGQSMAVAEKPASSSANNGLPVNGLASPSTPSGPLPSLGGVPGGVLAGKVAIVTPQQIAPPLSQPQRSNSLDYLNFEEKRQLIASSLSLSDFLHTSTLPVPVSSLGSALGSAATKVIVGECPLALCLRLPAFPVSLDGFSPA